MMLVDAVKKKIKMLQALLLHRKKREISWKWFNLLKLFFAFFAIVM